MKKLYTTSATSTGGGREGQVSTDDKSLSFEMTPPGSGKKGANPEQLFACGYAACFNGAVNAVAKKQGKQLSGVEVQAEVSLNQDDSGYFISVNMNVNLPGIDKQEAEKIVKDAHQMCPYSKATRNNIEVNLTVNSTPISQAA